MGNASRRRGARAARGAAAATVAGLLACAAGLLACSRSAAVDPTRLRIFFTSDALGFVEPCG